MQLPGSTSAVRKNKSLWGAPERLVILCRILPPSLASLSTGIVGLWLLKASPFPSSVRTQSQLENRPRLNASSSCLKLNSLVTPGLRLIDLLERLLAGPFVSGGAETRACVAATGGEFPQTRGPRHSNREGNYAIQTLHCRQI